MLIVNLIELLATLALLGVTAWYAKTTKDMANTAKGAAEASERAIGAAERSAEATKEMAEIARQAAADSARATAAAERSADAARDAATVAQSQISPEFRGRIIPAVDQDDEGERIAHKVCLHIKSVGDAVVVQEVRILRAFGPGDRLSNSDKPVLVDETMEPFDDESVMPRRLHFNETILVTHPAMNDGEHTLERFILSIRYTFREDGTAGSTRRLVVSPDSKW